MRFLVNVMILAVAVLGCTRDPATPGFPGPDSGKPSAVRSASLHQGPHRLWGEWTLYINDSHDKVDVTPNRHGQFHLNALKFLEEYCADCLKITALNNNGDGTIDLTVSMQHPFKGLPEYTGFDVKGILMFEGSYILKNNDPDFPPPNPIRMSWRKFGDPEVLNPDGFTLLWSPSYKSGSDLPIFNYWEGKHANGTPTADLNAFKNFYSKEERHIFETDSTVVRTYTIWLPAGKPIIVGYAVDASWEPPLVMPVTDPVTDFPITANQPELYRFEVVVNDGLPITDCTQCCEMGSCEDMYVEAEKWGQPVDPQFWFVFHNGSSSGLGTDECTPPPENRYPAVGFDSCVFENGWYRGYAYHSPWPDPMTFTIFDYIMDY